ncbi:contact-dependent growth inhibition system immunity protein [Agromyces sp. MMS24-JH15]|uniref:contact-dependent growth inhibition system immunity protein n=1 Tax=Agromyces sp. MMS24-JH15 TaxID=3243765 RepID=UPI0037485FD3
MGSPANSSELVYLGQCYFNPDYDLDAAQPIGIIWNFRRDETASTIQSLRAELTAILAEGHTEEDLARIWIDEADSYYDPRDDGISMREWFQRVLDGLG